MILTLVQNPLHLPTLILLFFLFIHSRTQGPPGPPPPAAIDYCSATDLTIDWTDDSTIWCSCGKGTCTDARNHCLKGNNDEAVVANSFDTFARDLYGTGAKTCMAFDESLHTNFAKIKNQNIIEKCPGTECEVCSQTTPTSSDVGCATCPTGASSVLIFKRTDTDPTAMAGGMNTISRCITQCETQRSASKTMYALAGTICYPCNYTTGCYSCVFNVNAGPPQSITPACSECSYQYARVSSVTGARTCGTPSPPPQKQTSPFVKTYYLTPSDASRTVAGSPVYTQLNDLLRQITSSTDPSENPYYSRDVTITIYLLKETDSSGVLSHYWVADSTLGSYQTDVFKRLNATWTIKPLFQNDTTNCPLEIQDYCYDPTVATEQKATVKFKSSDLVFYVSSQATIQNIIFDGADLAFYDPVVLDCAQKTDGMCCVEDSSMNGTVNANVSISEATSSTLACQPTSGDAYTLIKNLLQAGTFTRWNNKDLGLFTMVYLDDYPTAPVAIPTLTLTNCEFRNFWTHQKVSALITMDPKGSNVAIDNCIFSNFLFYNGLITNTWGTVRNFPGLHDPDVYSSLCTTSSCSVSITNSKFQYSNYGNYRYYFNNTNDRFIYNEGIVLFLKDFDGSISIAGNTFQYLASTLRSEQNPFRTEGICEFKVDKPTGSPTTAEPDGTLLYTTASTQKINTNSYPWKIYVDKLFYTNTYEMYPNLTPSTTMTYNVVNLPARRGSILNLQGITKGLIIKNNTFHKNIGYSGTAFIVDNFTNTATNPIVVYDNVFSNNFGLRMGATFIIVKERRDYRTLMCNGIYIYNNVFTENVGCEDNIGNALILCMPKLIPFIFSSYYSNRESISTAYDYFVDYSISTNHKDSAHVFPRLLFENLLKTTSYTETSKIFFADLHSIVLILDSEIPVGSGLSWDTSRVVLENNTFIRNAAIVSQGIIVSGALKVTVINNTFSDNFPPLTWLWGSGPYQNSAFKGMPGYESLFNSMQSNIGPTVEQFDPDSSKTVALPSSPASPVVIRMAVGVSIVLNIFSNNSYAVTAGITTSVSNLDPAVYMGAAITMDRILGTEPVNISSNTFQDHNGLFGMFPPELSILPTDQSLIKTNFHIVAWNQSYCPTSLISIGFWPMFASSFFSFDSVSAWSDGAVVLLESNIFSNSKFRLMGEIKGDAPKSTAPSELFSSYQTAILKVARYWEIIFGLTSTSSLSTITDWEISYKAYPFYNITSGKFQMISVTNNTFETLTIYDSRPLFSITRDQLFTASSNTFKDLTVNFMRSDNITQYNALFRQYYDSNEFDTLISGVALTDNTFSDSLGAIALITADQTATYTQSTVSVNNDTGFTFANNIVTNYRIQLALITVSSRTRVTMTNNSISSIVQEFSLSTLPNTYSSITNNMLVGIITLSSLTSGNVSTITNNTLTNVTTNFFSGITLSKCQNVFLSGTVSNVTFNIPNFGGLNVPYIRTSLCVAAYSSSNISIDDFLCDQTNIVVAAQDKPMTQVSFGACLAGDVFLKLTSATTNKISNFICSNSQFILNGAQITDLESFPVRAMILENSPLISVSNLLVANVSSSVLIDISATTGTFDNCTFTNSTSYNMASGLAISGSSDISMTSSSFSELICTDCEAIVWIENSVLTANLTTFTDNTCATGGTLYAKISSVALQSVTLSNNTCSSGSGILYLLVSNAAIDNSSFSDNAGDVASIQGFTSTAAVTNSEFNRNTANSGSDNFELYDSEFTITTSSHIGRYTGSSAYSTDLQGGFLKAVRTSVTMADSTFANSAGSFGGFVYYESDQRPQNITIMNCSFTTGFAIYGGAIYYNGLLDISSSSFLNNTATEGSAIWGTGFAGYLADISALNNRKSNFYFENLADSILIENADISISDDSEITEANGIYCLNSNLTLTDVTVTGMITSQNGGGLRFLQNPYKTSHALVLDIADSNFSFNQAANGGGIYIHSQILAKIANTSIANNTAKNTTKGVDGSGGGIYYNCNNYLCNLTISLDTELANNTAGVAGGGIKIAHQPPYEFDTSPPIFSENTAPYGNDTAYYPVEFQEVTLEEMQSSPVADILKGLNYTFSKLARRLSSTVQQSGLAIDPPLVFKVLDEKGMLVTVDDSTTMKVMTIDPSWEIRSESDFVAKSGYIVLYPLNITINPGEIFQFNITVPQLNASLASYNRTELSYFKKKAYFYSYKTSECSPGQIISDINVCSTCSEGEYYLEDPAKTACVSCNDSVLETADCAGSFFLFPKKDYWRFDRNQEKILRCLNQHACLGYSISLEDAMDESKKNDFYCPDDAVYNSTTCLVGFCAKGYRDNLCAGCTEGYARGNFITQTCIECATDWSYYLINILVFLAAVALILFSTKKALKNYKINIDKKHKKHPHHVPESLKGIHIPDSIERNNKEIVIPSNEISPEKSPQKLISSGDSMVNVSELIDDLSPVKQPDLPLNVKLEESIVSKKIDETLSPSFIKSDFDASHIVEGNKRESKELVPAQVELKDASSKAEISPETPKDLAADADEKKRSVALEQPKYPDATNVYIKIFLTYFQILAVMGELDFGWGDRIKVLFNVQNTAQSSSSNTLNFDCLLDVGPLKSLDIRPFFRKLLIFSFTPLFGIVIAIIIWQFIFIYWSGIKFYTRCGRYSKNYWVGVASSSVIFLFMIYPTIFQQSLFAFKCMKLGIDNSYTTANNQSLWYMSQDLQVECFSTQHLKWAGLVATPSLLIWGLGLPLFSFLVIYKHRKRLDTPWLEAVFGYLYKGFREKAWFWEFISIFRKVILVVITVFLQLIDSRVQGLIALLVGAISYLASLFYQPYEDPSCNRVEKLAMNVALITAFLGNFIVFESLSDSKSLLIFVIMVTINAYFVVVWLYVFFKYEYQHGILWKLRLFCLKKKAQIIEKRNSMKQERMKKQSTRRDIPLQEVRIKHPTPSKHD